MDRAESSGEEGVLMNLSSIGSASSVTSGFLSEPPLSPGPAPVPDAGPVPQLRTVDTTPAAEASTGPEPEAPVPPLAPSPLRAPAPAGSAEGETPPVASTEEPAAPAVSPSLESTLLWMRLVTPDQIASAMREEAETGRSIAEIVVANGWVTAEDLPRLQAPTTAPTAAVSAPEPVAVAPVTPPAPVPAPEPPAPAAAPAVASAPDAP